MSCGKGDSVEHPLEIVDYTEDEIAALTALGEPGEPIYTKSEVAIELLSNIESHRAKVWHRWGDVFVRYADNRQERYRYTTKKDDPVGMRLIK